MKKLFLILMVLLSASGLYAVEKTDTLRFVYKLHGQTRKFRYVFEPQSDGGVTLHWGIERNLKWWSGTYAMSSTAMDSGDSLSLLMPEDGNHIKLEDNETFALISRNAYRNLKDSGVFRYDGVEYELLDKDSRCALGVLLHARDEEGEEIWILDNAFCPLIWQMTGNPLEIDWKAEVF
jgi:hypothetical protein